MTAFLLDAFEQAAGRGGSLTLTAAGGDETVAWAQVHAEAIGLAGFLQMAGIGRGTAVGLLGTTSRTLVTAIRAVWLAGASVTVLTPPTSSDLTLIADSCHTAVRGADLDVLLLCPPFDPFTAGLTAVLAAGGCRVLAVDDQMRQAAIGTPYARPDLTNDDTALRQFTSGSTGEPKAVRITHGNLAANLTGIMHVTRHEEVPDCLVSWLPLFHDMGLIGFLALPMVCGACRLVLSTPEEFLARPTSWLQNVSRYRGTAIGAPAFAYGLAGRLLPPDTDLDLSAVRFALCGAEPIDPDVIAAFTTRAGQYGFNPAAIVCAFGMAEATLAVSLVPPGRGMHVDEVDTAVLQTGKRAVPASPGAATTATTATTRLPRLGPPLPGIDVRVVDPNTGLVRGDRDIGDIQLRGPSVSPGYIHTTGPDGLLSDGWLSTGDLGYLADGDIVVCGRLKDVLIVGGSNITPHEVERAASRAEGARTGRVAAFRGPDRPGTDTLVVAVEARTSDTDALRDAVITAVVTHVGLRPHAVIILAPGTLPKTTSGKIRRTELRRRYLAGELAHELAGEPIGNTARVPAGTRP